jgi:DNA-binding GntR family transcriptional regulator
VSDPALSGIRVQPGLRDRRISADYIADSMRDAILAGELADGAVLNQVSLASLFGVSRVPVREAMRQLQAEGLIETRAHRVAVVRGLDSDRIAELYALRSVLEGWVIELAAPHLDAGVLAVAHDLNEEMRQEVDHPLWLALNARFHRCLSEPSGALTTLELLGRLRQQSERYVRLWSRSPGLHRTEEAYAEHAQILACLRDGRTADARTAVEEHVLHTRDRVVAYGQERATNPEAMDETTT